MAIFTCPECDASLKIPDALAEKKKVKCPKCGALIAPIKAGKTEPPGNAPTLAIKDKKSTPSIPAKVKKIAAEKDEPSPIPSKIKQKTAAKAAARQDDDDDDKDQEDSEDDDKDQEDSEDDDLEDRPRKKKKGRRQPAKAGSSWLLISLGAGSLGAAAIVVILAWVFSGGGEEKKNQPIVKGPPQFDPNKMPFDPNKMPFDPNQPPFDDFPPIKNPPRPKDDDDDDDDPKRAPPAELALVKDLPTELNDMKEPPMLVTDPGGHTDMVKSVLFAGNGQLLITASHDKTVRLWETRTGQPLGVSHLPIGPGNE